VRGIGGLALSQPDGAIGGPGAGVVLARVDTTIGRGDGDVDVDAFDHHAKVPAALLALPAPRRLHPHTPPDVIQRTIQGGFPPRPAACSGCPVDKPPRPAAYSGCPVDKLPRPAAYSGRPVDKSARPAAYSGCPVDKSARPAAYSGCPVDKLPRPAAYSGCPVD